MASAYSPIRPGARESAGFRASGRAWKRSFLCASRSALHEIKLARGGDRRLDAWTANLRAERADPAHAELCARRTVERIALPLEASLLVRFAPPFVADAFCAGRLGEDGDVAGLQFGALPRGMECTKVVQAGGGRVG